MPPDKDTVKLIKKYMKLKEKKNVIRCKNIRI